MLTLKQERFVQELVKGKSQREAYKASYDASRMLDSTIDNKAYILFKKDEIRARYEEIMHSSIAKTQDDAESMRAFIIETYKKIASGQMCEETTEYDADGNVTKSRKSVKPSDVNNAIAKLAEYYGVTPEINVTHDVNVVFADNLKEYSE